MTLRPDLIRLCQVLVHSGIPSNETADALARIGSTPEGPEPRICQFYNLISQSVVSYWLHYNALRDYIADKDLKQIPAELEEV